MIVYQVGGYDPAKPFNNASKFWDIRASTFHDYATGADVTRPFTPEEVARFAEQALKDAAAANEQTTRAEIQTQVDALAVAIADIQASREVARGIRGLLTDPAGVTSLRAWKAQAPAVIVTSASLKGLADLMINTLTTIIDAQGQIIAAARALKRVSRIVANANGSTG